MATLSGGTTKLEENDSGNLLSPTKEFVCQEDVPRQRDRCFSNLKLNASGRLFGDLKRESRLEDPGVCCLPQAVGRGEPSSRDRNEHGAPFDFTSL